MRKRKVGWAGLPVVTLITTYLLTVSSAVIAGDVENLGSESQETAGTVVVIQNVRFEPSEIHIKVGTTVDWVNRDPAAHDVTSGISILGREARKVEKPKLPDGKFSSGLFGKDKTFSHTFDSKGEYPYYCNIHSFMVGKVIVE